MLEVTAIVFIVGVIFSTVMPNYVGRINHAKYEKTVNELTAIARASTDFFLSVGSWPTGTSQLAPQFMAQAVTSSPFGSSYQIIPPIGGNNVITVSVLIPAGIAQNNPQGPLLVVIHKGGQDQIEISQTVNNQLTSRLKFDLKNVY